MPDADSPMEKVFAEVGEETGIELREDALVKVSDTGYSFIHDERRQARQVHIFLALVLNTPGVHINQTLTSAGTPEDKHDGYRWLSLGDLVELAGEGYLAQNSAAFHTAIPFLDRLAI
ncbi:MAG: hypothetical protein HY430_00040 [Candidatus Levybacteria bacterium]|nr:hypothetical protein [Candidatus Levybacteria bacterium]